MAHVCQGWWNLHACDASDVRTHDRSQVLRICLLAAAFVSSGCASGTAPSTCAAKLPGAICLDLSSAGSLVLPEEADVTRVLDNAPARATSATERGPLGGVLLSDPWGTRVEIFEEATAA